MPEKPSTNPYAPSQIQADAKVFQLGPEWERVPNPDYDGALFPRAISFRGEFQFKDFKLLSKGLFQQQAVTLRLYVLNIVIIWTALIAIMCSILKVSGSNPADVLDVRMLIIPVGISLIFVGLVLVQRRRFFPKNFLPVSGTIESSGIISQKRNQKTNTLIDATSFYAWNDLFYLEQLSENGVDLDFPVSNAVATKPLPLRIILHTKDEKQSTRGKLLFSKRRPTFFLMHCLEPKMFSDPNDWQMLVEFARLHLAGKKHEGLNHTELVE